MASVHGGYDDGVDQQPVEEPVESGKSSFMANIGFLKSWGEQRKTTRDGQLAKRRGPKPDAKPALTRRQELNRQAQRTHRERKEQYIRALESEISRLREGYSKDITSAHSTIQHHRIMLQELEAQNETLKDVLRIHGIEFEAELERRIAEYRQQHPQSISAHTGDHFSPSSDGSPSNDFSASSTGILATSSPFSATSPDTGRPNASDFTPHIPTQTYYASSSDPPGYLDFTSKTDMATVPPSERPLLGIFEEDPQLGINFILTLESPCRWHTEYLCRLSANDKESDSVISGHALMASCPPPSHIDTVSADTMYPHKTYDLPAANLQTLLNLSRQLITEGQVTPIMILQALKNHELYHQLTREDIKIIIDTLNTKIRCYGFGAVIEDFELRDCLNSVLGSKTTLSNVTIPPARGGEEALY